MRKKCDAGPWRRATRRPGDPRTANRESRCVSDSERSLALLLLGPRTMTVLLRRRVLKSALLLAFLLLSSTALAQDAVLAGYRKYYAGDRAGARQALEAVLASNPGSLPARFGLLHILMRRADEERGVEKELERNLEAFLADAEKRHDRSNGQDFEAIFYLANGYMMRAQYRVNHDKGMWGAARDGAKAKRLIDAYVRRYPEHGDAYFTLGLYNYYVDIAPSFVRVLRLFLFLPGGNRADGLKQIERAYSQGSLFAFPAGMILMEIYSTYEHRGADAVRVGERLFQEYPANPDVGMQLAEVYASPAIEDYSRAAAQYEGVLKRESARPSSQGPAKHSARLGLASMQQQQWHVQEAIAGLSEGIAEDPGQPVWVMPNLLLRRGNYRALLADPAAAEDAKRVKADARWQDFQKAADDQLAWIERRRQSGEEAIYAALVPGNRLVAEKQWDQAATAYEKVRQQHPNDLQVRYRLAYLRFMRGDPAGAAGEFAPLSETKSAPSWMRAASLLYLARAHDLAGRRADAIKIYDRILDDYERESAAFRAQVGLVTPYRRVEGVR